MPTKETIEALYKRYLDNDTSKEELEDFLQRLHIHEDELSVSSLMDGTWQEMFETKESLVVPMYKRRGYRVAAAVAIIVMLSIGGYLIFEKNEKQRITAAVKNDVAPGGNRATLTLANGKQIILDSAANGTLTQQGNTKIIKLDSGQLAYNATGSTSGAAGEVLYNTVTTPNGGQYQVVLADGSKVWLNAASSLRFPTAFIKERNVELTGEGYFEITKNASMPFHVNVSGMQVEVLGTHFNVNAYTDEAAFKTTLLEGSVKILSYDKARDKQDDKGVVIKPGQQAVFGQDRGNPSTRQIMVQTVDVDEATAWKDGLFHFESADLKTILRQFARWYDVEVIYEGPVKDRKFFGVVKRSNTLSKVLEILRYNDIMFRIEGRKLMVKSG